jgi:hypothetical protein
MRLADLTPEQLAELEGNLDAIVSHVCAMKVICFSAQPYGPMLEKIWPLIERRCPDVIRVVVKRIEPWECDPELNPTRARGSAVHERQA